MYPIRNLIAIMETTNATTIPIDQDHHLCSCERETEFQNFQKTGSNMTGIPRKKVNSAATVREGSCKDTTDNGGT